MKTLSPLRAKHGFVVFRSVLLLVMLCFVISSNASITGDHSGGKMAATYCDIDGDEYTFTILSSGGAKLKKPHVMLSLDKDFSRIKYIFALNNRNSPYTVTVNSAEIESATYYWRAADADGNMMVSSDGPMITLGSKTAEEYVVKVDSKVYGEVTLGDETELSLESVWLRTENNGNRMEWANAPYCSKTTIFTSPSDEYTNSHGIVVRNNVIYVARGTYNVSNWKYDKEQVWLDRYDLTTGATLPMLRVRQDDNNDYVSTDLMSLIGEDAAGTVYFTSSIVNASGSKIQLYTVDLANIVIEDGYEVALSHLEGEFTVPVAPKYMRFLTVRGSIKSGNYTLWGAEGKNDLEPLSTFEVPVYRWKVENGSTSVKAVKIKQFATVDVRNAYEARLISPKVVPISDDLFYFHARPFETDVLFHPALYRMPSDNGYVCEMRTSLSDADKSLHNTMAESPLGVSLMYVNELPILAYGRRADQGSSVQLLEMSPMDMSFATAKSLWNINPEGFSKINVQGCNIVYLPDSEDSPTGNLVVYVPNGGIGLYRLTAKGTTVGIDSLSTGVNMVVGRDKITLSEECRDIKIVDMSGRICLKLERGVSIDVSSLASGVYFVVSPTLDKPCKILLK